MCCMYSTMDIRIQQVWFVFLSATTSVGGKEQIEFVLLFYKIKISGCVRLSNGLRTSSSKSSQSLFRLCLVENVICQSVETRPWRNGNLCKYVYTTHTHLRQHPLR